LGHAVQNANIAIPQDASFEDIEKLLRENIPKPFQYFDETWSRDYPAYVFGYTEGNGKSVKIKIYQTTVRPNGREVRLISEGPMGKGIVSNQLILGK